MEKDAFQYALAEPESTEEEAASALRPQHRTATAALVQAIWERHELASLEKRRSMVQVAEVVTDQPGTVRSPYGAKPLIEVPPALWIEPGASMLCSETGRRFLLPAKKSPLFALPVPGVPGSLLSPYQPESPFQISPEQWQPGRMIRCEYTGHPLQMPANLPEWTPEGTLKSGQPGLAFSPSLNEPFAAPFNSSAEPYYLISDAVQFDAFYGTADADLSQLGPQQTLLSTSEALATVAGFRSAVLDVDLHSISIPIDLSVNLTNRIQARLSFGPTFNLFDTELTTETYYQLLDTPPARVLKNDTARNVYQSPYDSNIFGNKNPGVAHGTPGRAPTATSTSASDGASTAGASGGKGSSDGRSRKLPGKNLARQTHHDSGQHFELGAFGQLTVQLDLDAAKRWFVEVYARYDYVPKFTISDGATSSVIDASSWGSGIGIGFRF